MLWRERCAQRFAGTKPGCVVAIYELVGAWLDRGWTADLCERAIIKALRSKLYRSARYAPPETPGYFEPAIEEEIAIRTTRAAEGQQRKKRATNEERKIEPTAAIELPPSLPPTTEPKRSEHGPREPDVRTVTADQVATVLTNKLAPLGAINVTPPREAATLTVVAGEPVSPRPIASARMSIWAMRASFGKNCR